MADTNANANDPRGAPDPIHKWCSQPTCENQLLEASKAKDCPECTQARVKEQNR